MITIPLYVFLFAYFIFLAIFVSFMLVNLYHIVISSSLTFVGFMMSFFIFATTVLVIYFTITLINNVGIDWKHGLKIFDTAWLTGSF